MPAVKFIVHMSFYLYNIYLSLKKYKLAIKMLISKTFKKKSCSFNQLPSLDI